MLICLYSGEPLQIQMDFTGKACRCHFLLPYTLGQFSHFCLSILAHLAFQRRSHFDCQSVLSGHQIIRQVIDEGRNDLNSKRISIHKDLDAFVADFNPAYTASRLYEEAILIFLAAKGGMNEENFVHYHIAPQTFQDFNRFVSIYKRDDGAARNLTAEFGKSYWYYFYFAAKNEKK